MLRTSKIRVSNTFALVDGVAVAKMQKLAHLQTLSTSQIDKLQQTKAQSSSNSRLLTKPYRQNTSPTSIATDAARPSRRPMPTLAKSTDNWTTNSRLYAKHVDKTQLRQPTLLDKCNFRNMQLDPSTIARTSPTITDNFPTVLRELFDHPTNFGKAPSLSDLTTSPRTQTRC